jgi:two-component system phosphate regulon sensor histidine kinase PhoR
MPTRNSSAPFAASDIGSTIVRWTLRSSLPLAAPYLVAVAVFAAVVAMFANRALERQHLQTRLEEGVELARLAGNALPWGVPDADLQALCRRLAETTLIRLTVISPDGVVRCDSEAVPANMENHLQRPEVQAALAEGQGYSVRRSPTTGERFLYRTTLQRTSSAARIVRVALPIAGVSDGRREIRRVLLLSFVLAALGGLWPAIRLSRRLGGRITAMLRFAQAVATDRDPPPLPLAAADALGALEANLAAMGRTVRERLRAVREEEHKLRAVLGGMVEGVVVINGAGDIVLLNDRAGAIFALAPTEAVTGRALVEICRDPELQQLVRDTIRATGTATPLSREIALTGRRPRTLAVNAAPVQGDTGPLGYVLVFHDITELQRLEAVRRDFVANVSHELRTPLTAIRGYAETLLRGALDDRDNAGKFLAVIERNAERLTRLIDDLLTLSDLELGRAALQRTAVDVPAAVAAAVELVAEKARRGDVRLEHDHDATGVPTVRGDSDRIEQVLVNLIDNAVKYTPPGGRVHVHTAAVGVEGGPPAVEVVVRDSGIGIPAHEIPRLTERFYRVDKARSRELGGTGLGLAIVKHIVQAHRGTLRVESEVGKGTTVRVRFPVDGPRQS